MRPLLIGTLIGGVASAAVIFLLRSHIFAVNAILVRGNSRLSTGEVQAVLAQLRGESIFSVDLERSRTRLADSPWLSAVTLRRLLPSTIEVTVVERVPLAIARLGQQLYLVDATGVIIDEYGAQYADFDLPIVDGLVPADAPGGTIDPQRARFLARFLDLVGARPDLRARLSQVDVTDVHDAVVLLKDDPAFLHLGEAQFVERIQRYLELAPTLNEKLSGIDYADLRFDERLFVRSRKASAAVSTANAAKK
jgi:cell division protein FtsQ